MFLFIIVSLGIHLFILDLLFFGGGGALINFGVPIMICLVKNNLPIRHCPLPKNTIFLLLCNLFTIGAF